MSNLGPPRFTFPADCGLKVGDKIHFHPDHLQDLVIISEEQAEVIANSRPQRTFVVTSVGGAR